jgi:DNA polymerase III gamma/tau subunit
LEERFAYAQALAAQLSQHQRFAAEVAKVWLSWWRDLMLIKGSCKEAIINIDYEAVLEKQAKALSLSEIERFISKLNSVQEGISRNVSPRLAFESLMLNLPRKGEGFSGN